MKEAIKVDLTGALVDVELVADDAPEITDVYEPNPDNPDELVIVAHLISKKVPAGTFTPVWDFSISDWTEGLTPEEIDAIRNAPQPETDGEKLAKLTQRLAASEQSAADNSLTTQQLLETLIDAGVI